VCKVVVIILIHAIVLDLLLVPSVGRPYPKSGGESGVSFQLCSAWVYFPWGPQLAKMHNRFSLLDFLGGYLDQHLFPMSLQ